MASGGRYYVIEGKRYTESEYLRMNKKTASAAKESTPKSGRPSKGSTASKPSDSKE
jgi:hypothetical protein